MLPTPLGRIIKKKALGLSNAYRHGTRLKGQVRIRVCVVDLELEEQQSASGRLHSIATRRHHCTGQGERKSHYASIVSNHLVRKSSSFEVNWRLIGAKSCSIECVTRSRRHWRIARDGRRAPLAPVACCMKFKPDVLIEYFCDYFQR